jgi:hypothetical protein
LTQRAAIVRTVASCLIAVSLIAEWPLALALSAHHIGRALRLHDESALCLATKSGAKSLPAKLPGAPAKTAPCPVCQGLQAAKAPLPDAPAFARSAIASTLVRVPEPVLWVAGRGFDPNQPRGPPLA